MKANFKRWQRAQAAEVAFWELPQMHQYLIQKIESGFYAQVADRHAKWVEEFHSTSVTDRVLEVGSAAIGAINHWPTDVRWGIDPMAHYFSSKYGMWLNRQVRLVCAIGEAIPFTNNFFDLVLCGVLNHVILPSVLLREIGRVMSSKAFILVSTVVHYPIVVAGLQFREKIERYLGATARKDFHFYSVKSLRKLVVDCGFVIIAERPELRSSILPNDELGRLGGLRWELLAKKTH